MPIDPLDPTGCALRERVTELLELRPDISRQELADAIDRGRNWVSEFLTGSRATNDLRLVMKVAALFGVPVGYLIAEPEASPDGGLLSLHSLWPDLGEEERGIVLTLAASLRGRGAAIPERPTLRAVDAPRTARRRS